MINIDYSNGKIRVETKKVSSIFKLPLKLSIRSHVNGKEIWSSQLNDGWWAEYPNNEMNDAVIFDSEGRLITFKEWDVRYDGSELYKTFYYYCTEIFKSGRRPKGIAVGTHDGLFGEWVPCVIKNYTDAILVEASEKQFNNLKENFSDFRNVNLVNSLITSDGQPAEFFEGGLGYTNSIVEKVIRSWEKEEINSTLKESKTIEYLINELMDGHIDWIHTDVEGYDSKIIMSIPNELLPKMIMFEHENMSEEENELLNKFLVERGYNLNYQKVSCVGIK
jgi:hypothetical protein